MGRNLFWLNDEQWGTVEPFMPKNQPGARRKDDRRIISGIFHVLKSGCRWRDCPEEYGPHTTVYNRFNRWSRKRFWTGMLEALAKAGAATGNVSIDASYVKVQRSAFGGKGACGAEHWPLAGGNTTKVHALTDVIGRPFQLLLTPGTIHDATAAPELLSRLGSAGYVLADKGYDADTLREIVRRKGAKPVIPGKTNRKRKIPLDKHRYKARHLIENAFCRLKDFRRVATRYDKLAQNYLSGVALATILAYWM